MKRDRKTAKIEIESLYDAGPAESEEAEKARQDQIVNVERARGRTKETRERQRGARKARIEQEADNDPGKWQCPNCYLVDQEGRWSDCCNTPDQKRCRKCSTPRPAAWERWAGARWMCRDCSHEGYSVSGLRDECPDCGRLADWSKEVWWWMPSPPEQQQGGSQLSEPRPSGPAASAATGSSASGSQAPPNQDPGPPGDQVPMKKRKRAGKKHKKKQPPTRAAGDEKEDDRVRRHGDDEPSSDEEGTAEVKRGRGGRTSAATRMRASIPACTLPLGALLLSDLAVKGASQPAVLTAGGAAVSAVGVAVLMLQIGRAHV